MAPLTSRSVIYLVNSYACSSLIPVLLISLFLKMSVFLFQVKTVLTSNHSHQLLRLTVAPRLSLRRSLLRNQKSLHKLLHRNSRLWPLSFSQPARKGKSVFRIEKENPQQEITLFRFFFFFKFWRQMCDCFLSWDLKLWHFRSLQTNLWYTEIKRK